MKDHEISQVVNQLTEVARTFGQSQQLRERISQLIVPLLKPEEPKTMLIAPFCIGKKCSCGPGNCAEVGMRPDTAVTVYVHDHSPAKEVRDGVQEIRERRTHLNMKIRELVQVARNRDYKRMQLERPDGEQFCHTTPP